MTIKTILCIGCAAAVAASDLASVFAQATSANADSDDGQSSLKMLVDYGQGKVKQRRSHRGVMEPVGLPAGQLVQITLEFAKKQAGQSVILRAMDGGEILPQGTFIVSAEGTIAFSFQTSSATGLYRLIVRGAEEHEIPLYAFDLSAPVHRPSGSGAH